MVIDLVQLNAESLEVKMLDGQTIHLPKPAYELFIQLADFETSQATGTERVERLYDIAIKCVNSNTDGRVYTPEALKDYPLEIINIFMREYTQFISGVMSRKNS